MSYPITISRYIKSVIVALINLWRVVVDLIPSLFHNQYNLITNFYTYSIALSKTQQYIDDHRLYK